MNLVGKILVVALLVMALVFASFTLAVHATHTNWRLRVSNTDPKTPGLTELLADRDALVARKEAELTEKQRLLERTLRESEQVRGQLESQVNELLTGRTALRTEIDNKTNALNLAVTNANNSATVLQKTQEENEALRKQNVDITKVRDDALASVVSLGDDVAQATGEWNRYQERNRQLLAQLAQYRLAMQHHNVPVNVETPPVSGLVTDTRTAEGMVEVNLGVDDGLKKGDKMDVFRVGSSLATTRYLGQIRLFLVEKTKAAGTVIPGTLKGTIEKNDHVSTELK